MEALDAAASAIAKADAMIIGSGAGLGVDSGLGTFRGRNAGVWQPLKAMWRDFSEMVSPSCFDEDARRAWAFWKFRHDNYTSSAPHEGYKLIAEWGASMPRGFFSVTSNIDGHWARTIGAEKTYEKQYVATGPSHRGRGCMRGALLSLTASGSRPSRVAAAR